MKIPKIIHYILLILSIVLLFIKWEISIVIFIVFMISRIRGIHNRWHRLWHWVQEKLP